MDAQSLPTSYLQLEQQRQHLLEKRQALERKHALRQSTLEELTNASSQAVLHSLAALKKDNASARTRNQQLLQDMQQLSHTFCSSDTTENLLQVAKENFVARVERAYPLWEETALNAYHNRLEEIENERRRVGYRRRINQEAYARRQAMETAVHEMQGQLALEMTREQEEELERQLTSSALQHQVRVANNLLAQEAMHRTFETKNKFAQQLREEEASLVHTFSGRLERSEQEDAHIKLSSTERIARTHPTSARRPVSNIGQQKLPTPTADALPRPPSPAQPIPQPSSTGFDNQSDAQKSELPPPRSRSQLAAFPAVPVSTQQHSPTNTSHDSANNERNASNSQPPLTSYNTSSEIASQASSGGLRTRPGSATKSVGEEDDESDASVPDASHDTDNDNSEQAVSIADIVQREHECARCLQDLLVLAYQAPVDQLTAAYLSLRSGMSAETPALVQLLQAVKDKSVWNNDYPEPDVHDVLATCCLLIQQFAHDLLPIELLSGVVTFQKVIKAVKPKSNALAEIWNQLEQHLLLLASDRTAAVEPAKEAFIAVFMCQLAANESKQEQTRLQRKIAALFSSIIPPPTPGRQSSPRSHRPTTPPASQPAAATTSNLGFQTPPPKSPDAGKKITNVSEPYMLSRSALGGKSQGSSGSSHGQSTRQHSTFSSGGDDEDEEDDTGFGSTAMSFLIGRGQSPIHRTPASSLARRASESDEDFL